MRFTVPVLQANSLILRIDSMGVLDQEVNPLFNSAIDVSALSPAARESERRGAAQLAELSRVPTQEQWHIVRRSYTGAFICMCCAVWKC